MSYALIKCEKKKCFSFAKIDEVYDEITIDLSFFNDKNSKKIAKKICKILRKYKINNVILSSELFNNEMIKNTINTCDNNIITGDNIFKALIKKSIKDICNLTKTPMQLTKVAIFVHEFSIENLNVVKYISVDVKQLIVISDNKNRFERIAEDLLDNYGISLLIFDVDYKNISRCDFIINLDFTEKELKGYNLSREAIIISIKENIGKLKNNFNGIIINDLDIYLEEKYNSYRSLAVCEAIIYDFRKNPKENERRFDKANYKINKYIGTNGTITEEDFKRVLKKSPNNT